MPTSELISKGRIIENSSVTLTARLRKSDDAGTPIVPADIDAIRLRVYDVTSASTVDGEEVGTLIVPEGEDEETYTGTDLDPEDIILDDLNTGYMADDDDGFNFRHDLHGSYFPQGGKTYRVEYLITPVAADPRYRIWELKTIAVYSE